MAVNAVLFAAQMISAPLIASYFQEPRVEQIVRVLAVGFLISPFIAMPEALLTRALDFRRRSLVELTANVGPKQPDSGPGASTPKDTTKHSIAHSLHSLGNHGWARLVADAPSLAIELAADIGQAERHKALLAAS